MVIQQNMSSIEIAKTWAQTDAIFKKYSIPLTKKPLEQTVCKEQLISLMKELNEAAGSSEATCIEGG